MMVPESIGKRIAQMRQQRSWTQQDLANRVGISRVAVSHIEMNLTIPSERTIALLASLFKMKPFQLVHGTTYPHGKAERLPITVCCYTELELDLALLNNDLAWLERLAGIEGWSGIAKAVRQKWILRLKEWSEEIVEPEERSLIDAARHALIAVTKRGTGR